MIRPTADVVLGTDPVLEQLNQIRELAGALQSLEMDVARARARLKQAIVAADGPNQAQIAQAAGIARQRVGQILAESKPKAVRRV